MMMIGTYGLVIVRRSPFENGPSQVSPIWGTCWRWPARHTGMTCGPYRTDEVPAHASGARLEEGVDDPVVGPGRRGPPGGSP